MACWKAGEGRYSQFTQTGRVGIWSISIIAVVGMLAVTGSCFCSFRSGGPPR
jgi:hypothetical protein